MSVRAQRNLIYIYIYILFLLLKSVQVPAHFYPVCIIVTRNASPQRSLGNASRLLLVKTFYTLLASSEHLKLQNTIVIPEAEAEIQKLI